MAKSSITPLSSIKKATASRALALPKKTAVKTAVKTVVSRLTPAANEPATAKLDLPKKVTSAAQDALTKVLQMGLALRNQGRWKDALKLYHMADEQQSMSSELKHNIALCYFALQEYRQALTYVESGLVIRSHWQSLLLKAKCFRRLGHAEVARILLEQMLLSPDQRKGTQSPEQDAVARIELAEIFLNEFCDARLAQEIVAPVLDHPVYAEKARLSTLMAKFYDRQESAYDFSSALKGYAKDYVQQDHTLWAKKSWGHSERARLAQAGIDPLDAFATPAKTASEAKQVGVAKKSKASSLKPSHFLGGSIREVPSMQALLEAHLQILPKNRRRLRIGVLSSMLHASPVYYLCFEFLKAFAKKHDLILFSRGSKRDWATTAFEEIAAEVRDVASLDHRQLAQVMHDSELDILFEMSGWMDVDGLKAVSTKPAPYQYKWLGGQAATTGLDCFDGYLCNPHQLPDVSPAHMAKLYSEPLLVIQEGATLYTPPAYMPKAQAAPGTYAAVIGNPSKLAHDWAQLLKTHRLSLPKELILIDHAYAKAYVRQTVAKRFDGLSVTLKFVAPKSHEDFLKQINQIHTVWDLGPYTAGLTACEVLHLKKNLLTIDTGLLYCERHSWAHCESVARDLAVASGSVRRTDPSKAINKQDKNKNSGATLAPAKKTNKKMSQKIGQASGRAKKPSNNDDNV